MLNRTWPTIAAVAVLLAGAGIAAPSTPRLVWNATASAPEGLYGLHHTDALQLGQMVAVRPPPALAAWLDARDYAPSGVLLVKQVAALPPSLVCRDGARVTIDRVLAADARPADRWGRALPVWRGCRRLGPQDVFLLNGAPGSLDSRYLGPLPRGSVVGVLSPLWLLHGAWDGV
ncbi:S26 family signal peptidase [Phenylobacterium aquaticum]|uniref:S26 family signal peptidase n=1 Tax=Phenylobacterium aquaticum TaxID=1763816 RepID=UPI001F5DC452|nr:S26 family signal peptidase [Phenylobacterium aquaticum]MCI3132862.1 S26 family signal peptidase [Phenylobacterium aquaticum]